MSNIARLISQAAAQGLATTGQLAFVNDTPNPDRYFTYPDVANANMIGGTDFAMSPSENALTGQLKYDISTGTYPVDKTKKMFPR